MRTRNPVIITTALLGLIGVAFFTGSPPLSSESPSAGMQGELLEYFGVASSDLAYAASSQEMAFTEGSPLQLAKVLGRPAAKPGDNPEEKALATLPKPVQPGQLRKASKAELLDRCNQNPNCRAKLQLMKQGKRPAKVLPAGKPGDSPEDKALSTLPKPVPPKPRSRPRSDLMWPENNSTILSWLNPFAVSEAYAQTAFSLYLTPQNRYSSTPYGYLNIYGSRYWGSYYLDGTGWITLPTYSNTENKPFAYVGTNIPAEGWYLINFEASPGKAKVRHQYNGPILDTWDFTSQSCNPCDYLAAEYLAAGYHYFYFWPDGTSLYFYSASVDSY